MSKKQGLIKRGGKLRDITKWIFNRSGMINLEVTDYEFSDAVYISILKKILEGLQNTEYYLNKPNPTKEDEKLFNSFKNVFENNIEDVIINYLETGVISIYRDEESNRISLVDNDDKYTYQILSTVMKAKGLSDYEVVKPMLDHIDNILNAVSTSIKRLGNLTLLTPKTEDGLPVNMDEQELKEFEEDIMKEYGSLSTQSQIKVMRRSFEVHNINLAGAQLRTTENLQVAIKVICDEFEVPYEIISAAIVGNPNQTGVYQEEAVKRLYITIEKYVKMFVKFAEASLKLDISYNITTKPQDDEKVKWETIKNATETTSKLLEMGVVTEEEAKNIIRVKLNLDNNE